MIETWNRYPLRYRAREMALISKWILARESGAVAGMKGSGRSNLLGFLCNRQDVLDHYLPNQSEATVLIPVDIYNLPTNDLASLYRTILHAFYWVCERFDADLQQVITELYLENRVHRDPFLPQTAVYDLLRLFQKRQMHVVLVINRFDRFCQIATPQMMNTLRGLRDVFKNTLTYLVGLLNDVAYLPDPEALGDMYELLVGRVCWVGAMTHSDAHQMLEREFKNADPQPNEAEIEAMLQLSGCFPSLLKAVAQWYFMHAGHQLLTAKWGDSLAKEYSIQFRLNRIWAGLTQAEQLALWTLQEQQYRLGISSSGAVVSSEALQQHDDILRQLVNKGLCGYTADGWWIASSLLAAYIAHVGSQARGGIRVDEAVRVIYQGRQTIEDLTPLEYEILYFLTKYPHVKHTRDDIIDNAWPEEEQREGITPNALQVHIRNIRKKIEPNPAQPCYLLTWHGRPGGYQFFPEGKPS